MTGIASRRGNLRVLAADLLTTREGTLTVCLSPFFGSPLVPSLALWRKQCPRPIQGDHRTVDLSREPHSGEASRIILL
jgi:hypothetical protein